VSIVSSEYEQNVGALIAEKKQQLAQLAESAEISKKEIENLNLQIEFLENLYDNYNLGMNYFRRARGGRAGLRE
jgi:colicin import membrane protein